MEAPDPFDVASTFIEVLIFLASGVLTGILTFMDTVLAIPGVAWWLVVGVVALLATSIVLGLRAMGRIVGMLHEQKKGIEREEMDPPDINEGRFRRMARWQLYTYGAAMVGLAAFAAGGMVLEHGGLC